MKMKKAIRIGLTTGLTGFLCLLLQAGDIAAQSANTNGRGLTPELTAKLAAMPLKCIGTEWPNKTGHKSVAASDHVLLPSELHPSFYGCLDWHSSVHGHWMLLRLLRLYPEFSERDRVVEVLGRSFQPEKLMAEAAYFGKYGDYTFERTYGWAWLLKLDQELSMMKDSRSVNWRASLKPLRDTMVTLWKRFLPKQTYAIRVGTHGNTAFGMGFALDWARAEGDTAFEQLLVEKAKEHFGMDRKIPAHLEPNGSDFFSPSLEAAELMSAIMLPGDFVKWFDRYYTKEGIERITSTPVVSDRTDYQLVHLDGLSLTRAWCMQHIAKSLPPKHRYRALFERTADEFIVKALPHVTSGNYGGDHWLASFAVYALTGK